jgi:hypothetical protein
MSFMHGRFLLKALVLLLLAGAHLGCEDARPQPAQVAEPKREPGSAFDAAATGAIQGRVCWEGPLPAVASFQIERHRFSVPADVPAHLQRANPNAPLVDPQGRGVHQAIVFLRGVEASKARPWDHPPVRVELRDLRLQLFQGEKAVRAAFVRQGEDISMYLEDRRFYSLHASGAVFFTYTFVEPALPRARRLEKQGRVRLTSANGYYWMEGHLFVDNHPYYARTDRQGHFRLDQVPAGHYDVICWLPNWRIARRDRDPESCLVTRVDFAPPLEQTKQVEAHPRRSVTVDFSVSAAAFP